MRRDDRLDPDDVEPDRMMSMFAGAMRIMRFGFVGAIGTIANLLIMGYLVHHGVHYLVAAAVAAELTIIGNFLLQERIVFTMNNSTCTPVWHRFWMSFGFNNAETLLRMPLLWLLVELAGMQSLLAQGGTLLVAFLLRYAFHSRVVYGSPGSMPQVQEPAAEASRK